MSSSTYVVMSRDVMLMENKVRTNKKNRIMPGVQEGQKKTPSNAIATRE